MGEDEREGRQEGPDRPGSCKQCDKFWVREAKYMESGACVRGCSGVRRKKRALGSWVVLVMRVGA